MTMYKFLLAIAIALIVRPYVYAADHYSLHSFKGNVTIESKGRSTKACKGMTLNPTDNIVIPNGGSAEVYNSLDKQIYRSATPGRISVTRLMINAAKTAADKFSSVGEKMRIGRKSSAGDQRVFVEKGMVKRSLATFDPDAGNAEMDIESVAMRLASAMAHHTCDSLPEGVTVDIESGPEQGAVSFGVSNSMTSPLYYNLLSFTPDKEIEISPLGQPEGCFVLLPGQQTVRSQKSTSKTLAPTILIATPVKFDLDKVTERANALLSGNEATQIVNTDLPVIIRPIF